MNALVGFEPLRISSARSYPWSECRPFGRDIIDAMPLITKWTLDENEISNFASNVATRLKGPMPCHMRASSGVAHIASAKPELRTERPLPAKSLEFELSVMCTLSLHLALWG